MKRKLLFMLFAVMASIGMLQAKVLTGKCGKNLTYFLDTETRVLTITGSGEMYDLDDGSDYSWYDKKSSVKSIQLPEGLTTIGKRAFNGFSSLTSITIPNSVTTIGDKAFYDCTSLTSVNISNSVTTIGWDAFGNCSSLSSVTIPNSVTTIGSRAFYNCYSLTSVTIPNRVTTISASTFYNCTSLTLVTIPNSVTTIEYRAFYHCSSLTSVSIPNSVTTISDRAFSNCFKLIKITCKATTPPTLEPNTFENMSKDYVVLYVPSNSINLYKQAGGWREFYDIRPLEEAPSAVEDVIFDASPLEKSKKIYHNGQIYILTPDGKKYTPTGAAL